MPYAGVAVLVLLLVFAGTTFTGLLPLYLAMWSRFKKMSCKSIW